MGYSEDSKGYNLINLSTNKAFIARCVQFEEEPLATVEVGEASSQPEPQELSKEFVEHDDSNLFDGDEFIADHNSPTRSKWAAVVHDYAPNNHRSGVTNILYYL